MRNDQLTELARTLGAPEDKGAGILLYKKKGYKVKKGETLFTMFAENEEKLSNALRKLKKMEPIIIRDKFSQKVVMNIIKDIQE